MTIMRIAALVCAAGLATGPAFGQSPYGPAGMAPGRTGFGTGFNPYSTSPLAASPYSVSASTGVTPFLPNPYSFNPFNPYLSGWGAGSALMGEAELLRSYGTVIISQEQSRILREQAMQAKIDTARRRFDFELYVKANTPTFADEQKKIARNTLKRIQIASNPVEIVNGKALNILLDDVRNFPLKKSNTDSIYMSQDILKQINVTTKIAGVGLLRNDGKFTWPVALADIVPVDQRKALEKQVQIVVSNAAAGKIDGQVIADINQRMDDIKRELAKRVNEIPTGRYLEADRFLSDFRDARQGVEEGQMAVQDKFTRFIVGGKSIQDVTDYLVSNGLRFAPATAGDEAGYRAFHSMMVQFDVALNNGTAPSESEKMPPQ